MKVDHICVGTREIRMNRKQMENVGKNAYNVPQLLFLKRQNLSNSYPNTVLQHLLDFGCRILPTGC